MARGGGYGRGGGGRGYGGGGNGATLREILDPMDQAMLDNYGAYSQAIMDTWQSFSGNDGQMTIVHDYIIPMSMDHIQFAKEEWPWSGDADEYLESVINCFDDEVMMRAFSETIFALYDTIADYWLESDSIQQDHDDILGHSAVHSTNPPWVG